MLATASDQRTLGTRLGIRQPYGIAEPIHHRVHQIGQQTRKDHGVLRLRIRDAVKPWIARAQCFRGFNQRSQQSINLRLRRGWVLKQIHHRCELRHCGFQQMQVHQIFSGLRGAVRQHIVRCRWQTVRRTERCGESQQTLIKASP